MAWRDSQPRLPNHNPIVSHLHRHGSTTSCANKHSSRCARYHASPPAVQIPQLEAYSPAYQDAQADPLRRDTVSNGDPEQLWHLYSAPACHKPADGSYVRQYRVCALASSSPLQAVVRHHGASGELHGSENKTAVYKPGGVWGHPTASAGVCRQVLGAERGKCNPQVRRLVGTGAGMAYPNRRGNEGWALFAFLRGLAFSRCISRLARRRFYPRTTLVIDSRRFWDLSTHPRDRLNSVFR